jgi:hypothetical protein
MLLAMVLLQNKRSLNRQTARHACSRSRIIGSMVLAGVLLCGSPFALAVPSAQSCELQAAAAHESLRVEELGNWEPVDDSALLIWAPGASRAHLIHLTHPVQGLSGAAILILIDGDHDGRITACGHDGIMVGDGQGGTARIKAIEYLSEKHTAELDRPPVNTIHVSLGPSPALEDGSIPPPGFDRAGAARRPSLPCRPATAHRDPRV